MTTVLVGDAAAPSWRSFRTDVTHWSSVGRYGEQSSLLTVWSRRKGQFLKRLDSYLSSNLTTRAARCARNGPAAHRDRAFLAHFAQTDEWVSVTGVRKLERSLAKAGRDHAFHTYEGTGHWFFEFDRHECDPEAAALAWERTLALLRRSG